MGKSAGRADDDTKSAAASERSVAHGAVERSSPPSSSTPTSTGAASSGAGEFSVLHGKFRVLAPRPSSGDQLIFKALHLGTGRRVELHLLREGVAASSLEAQRMQRAARAAGRAPHSNVLNVVDSGHDVDRRPFVVYEQFSGVGCDELVTRRGPCDLRLATEIIGQVLDGLTALHMRGVFHRQLRPEHVLVDGSIDELRVKLIGLGYSAIPDREPEPPELPRVYSRYLAPEARRREATVSASLDIYAAGVLLRYLLSGESALESELPPQIERAIARATADDREERFQTAEQFRACVSAIAGPSTRASVIPSGSLVSDLRFMLQRRSASAEERASDAPPSARELEGVVELYPVLLMIESLYARIGADGWRTLLQHLPELEQLLPAAGNNAQFRAQGVPSSLVRRMLSRADQLAARGTLRLIAELGEELSRRGLQRFCFALPAQLTPECLVACVPALWRSIARVGEVVLIEQRAGTARLSVRAQHAATLELSALFAGLLRGQLRALAPDAEVNLVAAEALGDGADIFVLTW